MFVARRRLILLLSLRSIFIQAGSKDAKQQCMMSQQWPGGAGSPIVYPPPEREEYHGAGVAARRPNPPTDAPFLQIVDRRVSVRDFAGANVSDAALHNALRVARLAPSAGNLQAYQVVLVRDSAQRTALARAALDQMWIAEAPAVLVFLADPERSARKYHERGRSLYAVQDATIAAAYTQLALEADGLSSCWVGAFHEDLVASIVVGTTTTGPATIRGSTLRPVVIMPVGVAAERHIRSRRRPIRKFVHHGMVGADGSSETRAKRKIDSPE